MGRACFALLDDSSASAAAPRSRLYTDLVETLVLRDTADFSQWLARMEAGQKEGLFAVGLFSFELGAQLQGIQGRHAAPELGQILLFRRCQRFSADEVMAWLAVREAGDGEAMAGIADVTASVSETEFAAAIEKIHAWIEAGDTYQVNYTWRLRFNAFGSPLTLYRRLRARQPVPYGALIALPEDRWIVSLSPELLTHHVAGRLTALPMKGTAAASADDAENARRAAVLAADPKNRAENLMIVDLLRNDFGRIARLGSVEAPALFEVTRFGEVLQMTSTVMAELASGLSLAQVLAAILPSGSVTGAPKVRTLEIIDVLETASRGYYTGAIGWFDASCNEGGVPDFCLSVLIRTLALATPDAEGRRAGEMGVGAGIVHDSTTAAEYQECVLKANFLTGLGHDFELLETMHITRGEGCRFLERHLARLAASARYFGFRYDEAAIRRVLANQCAVLPPGVPHRLRLALNFQGEIQVTTAPLLPLALPVKLAIARALLATDALFLRHKTSCRAHYDVAWRAAEAAGAFDVLFFNTRGELTEGARSTLFMKLSGRWHTPPLASGLLPGVMRAVILDDPAWVATERCLTLDDLKNAEAVVVCNALRGILPAVIDWSMGVG